MAAAFIHRGRRQPPNSARPYLRRVALAWFVGAGWMALVSGAVFYRFAKGMGLGPFTWGLLASMPYLATFFQIVGSLWAERTGRNKAIFFWAMLIQRLSWLVIAILPFLVLNYRAAAIASVLVLFFLQAACGNLGTPPWFTWMADLIPARIRGRFFGVRHRLAMVMFVAMSLLSGWLLNAARSGTGRLSLPWLTGWVTAPFPLTVIELCAACFAVGAILGAADILFFIRIPETSGRPPERPPNLRQLLGRPLRNPQFVRFLLFFSLFMLGSPGTIYYIWNNASERLGFSDLGAQVMLVVLPATGELLFAPLWGKLIDTVGRKTVWLISLAYAVLIPVCWLLVLPEYWWMGLIIPILGNISWIGAEQCNMNWLLHLASGEEGSSGYQAVFALAMAVSGALSGLLLGLLAKLTYGFHMQAGPFSFNYLFVPFVVATAIRLVAYVVLLPRVHDENRKPVAHAIRYALTLVFNAVDSMISEPLRLLTGPRRRRARERSSRAGATASDGDRGTGRVPMTNDESANDERRHGSK